MGVTGRGGFRVGSGLEAALRLTDRPNDEQIRSVVLYLTKDVRFRLYSMGRWMDTEINEEYSEAPNHFVYLRVVSFCQWGQPGRSADHLWLVC